MVLRLPSVLCKEPRRVCSPSILNNCKYYKWGQSHRGAPRWPKCNYIAKTHTSSTKFEPEAFAAQLGLVYIHCIVLLLIAKPSVDTWLLVRLIQPSHNHSFLEQSQSESIGNSRCSYSIPSLKWSSILGKILSIRFAPSKLPTKWLKSCGQVLTSANFIQKAKKTEKDKAKKQKQSAMRKPE